MASFSVVSNIGAANAQANLTATSIGLQRSIMRLSSGYRINNAGDDAAGLAVANTYRSTQAVLNQGMRNANDGLSALRPWRPSRPRRPATSTARPSTRSSRTSSEKSTVKPRWPV